MDEKGKTGDHEKVGFILLQQTIQELKRQNAALLQRMEKPESLINPKSN